jgi:hypothetical protein
MAPVRRHVEQVSHHHFECDHDNRQKQDTDIQFANENIGLLDEVHEFF